MRSGGRLIIALCAVILLACSSGTTARPGGLLSGIAPKSVFMLGPDVGWIVGQGFHSHDLDLRPNHTDTLRFGNGHWTPEQAPAVIFYSLFMLSPTDGWAGTDDGFYHFDGHQWTHDASFSFPPGSFEGATQRISSISLDSATDGWALSLNVDKNFIHYTGGKWQVGGSLITDRFYNQLVSISMASPSEGWAVGSHFMAHYDGTEWAIVDNPVATRSDVDLRAVAMVSPEEGWAVGAVKHVADNGTPTGPDSGIILHLSKGAWSIAATPSQILSSLTMVSPSEGWAAGVDPSTIGSAAFLHYANGQWTPAATLGHGPVISISMGSTTDGWAVSTDALYHYHDGAWTTAHVRGPNETM
jgi:hypothetical protein